MFEQMSKSESSEITTTVRYSVDKFSEIALASLGISDGTIKFELLQTDRPGESAKVVAVSVTYEGSPT